MATITHSVLQADRPVLPEWTRWAWASMTEREYWKPLFDRLNALRDTVEWAALLEGVRPAIYQYVSPEQLLQKTAEMAKYGLTVVPIAQMNRIDSYTSGTGNAPFDPSKPWDYRILIARAEVVPLILQTPNLVENDAVLGEVLGYPKCCRDFFLRTWGAGQVDTTWDQYAETGNANGPVEANILWRWMGVRWVSHLPCSFQCEATVEVGRRTREAVIKHGYVEEAKMLDMILSWPVRWSGVNGIAEIVGPCLKVSTRTDWAPPTDQRRFERSGRYSKPSKDIWQHNGFSSYAGMIESQKPIIQELIQTIPHEGAVIDLGCGNGRLLRTVKLHRSDINIGGVDTNSDAIISVQSSLIGKWHASPIQQLEWTNWYDPATTVLLQCPVRLTEMSEEDAARTKQAMDAYPIHIVYVYGDNLQRQPLVKWVTQCGYAPHQLTVVCDQSAQEVAIGILDLRK